MRNPNTTLAEDINEKWLLDHYENVSFICDTYNNLEENIFSITDKKILDKYDENDTFINKLRRKYTWDWRKDFDNGIMYDFPAELMTFSLNSDGEVLAHLTDLYLDRQDLDIPTIKYSYFFAKDVSLRLTVPTQADDGLGIAYITDLGELIIDNNQY